MPTKVHQLPLVRANAISKGNPDGNGDITSFIFRKCLKAFSAEVGYPLQDFEIEHYLMAAEPYGFDVGCEVLSDLLESHRDNQPMPSIIYMIELMQKKAEAYSAIGAYK